MPTRHPLLRTPRDEHRRQEILRAAMARRTTDDTRPWSEIVYETAGALGYDLHDVEIRQDCAWCVRSNH